jgi:hypothetical protein
MRILLLVPSVPQAALLALAAAAGCASKDQVLLTVDGDAPGAVALFVRVVDDEGVQANVHSAGDAEHPVRLPATVYLQLSKVAWAGAVIWVADAAGTVVAEGRTQSCLEVAASGKYQVLLERAPDGWSPAVASGCRCDPAEPLGPMCRPQPSDGGAADAAGPADTGVVEAGADGAVVAADALESPDDAAADGPAAQADASAVRVPNALFGFELAGPDWTSTDAKVTRDTTLFTQGAASLALTIGDTGEASVRSRSFMTSGLGATGGHLSVDLFVGQKQTGDSNMEAWVDCQSANVFGVYLGYKALTPLKAGAWTSLTYTLPGAVSRAFAGSFSDCQVWFHLAGAGLFRYDRMGFAP